MSVRTAIAATAALLLTTAPALAAGKNAEVRVPASSIKDATTRVCMPRSMSKTVGKDKTQPQVLCQTVEEWAGHGVTIVAR